MLEVKNPCNIVIIDSGVQKDHPLINDLNILGAGWHNGIWIDGSIEDDIGHGTAVYTILHRMIPCANLIMLKIFGKDMQCDVEVLVEAFKKALEYSPAIINLSCGLTYCDNITALHEVCRKAVGLGIIVVSAFDNSGALSWPAAFPEVIGVDMKLELESLKTYYCIENSPVNIVCCGKKQKTAWIPSITKQVEGTSFCTPIVSGKIAHLIMEGIQPYNIWNELKKNAVKVIEAKDPISNIPLFKIKKAIIFPFNKEIHSMARYYEQLYFKIEGFYDNKLLRNVGLDLSVNYNVNLKETVLDYKDIDWEDDFDTLVLGHCNKLNKWVKFDHTEYMIKKCINYKKNVYSFDDLSHYNELLHDILKNGNFYYTPHFNTDNLPVNFYGRLRKIGKPIIFVGGTSSMQGKFSLQLELRKFFIEEGIKVGQLGTEPSSLLFGFDEVFPIGYNSTVHLNTEEMAVAANYLISKIEDQDPDLIIIGAQGFMLSNNYSHRQQNDFNNMAMLWSCQPDSVLLMINESDSIEYIKRTIAFLESYVNTNVLCLVLSPTTKVITTVFGGIVTDPNNENTEIIYLIEQGTGKKVFKFNQISEIGETCIKYFTD